MCHTEGCTRDLQILRLRSFFRSVAPEAREPSITLGDVGRYVIDYLDDVGNGLSYQKDVDDIEGRQYYGTTAYNNYYGNTGYGVYGGGSSSTSYNGLDAALSALAFLAFGVWLFNLVLPKLQGSALGLTDLGRTSLPVSQRNHSDSYSTAGLVSHIFTNSQDLVNKIFSQGSLWNGRDLIRRWFGKELLYTAAETLTSAMDFVGKLMQGPLTAFQGKGRSRRWIAAGGQGVLDHVVSYLARILFTPPKEQRFPVPRSQDDTNK